MSDTDLTYPQPPTMTADHAAAMRDVVRIWPFAAVVPTYLIVEVAQHLEALLAQPVPSRDAPPVEIIDGAVFYMPQPTPVHIHIHSRPPEDWQDEPESTGQGEDPGPLPIPPASLLISAMLESYENAIRRYNQGDMNVTPDPEPMPAKIVEVLQTWTPTPQGVVYSATTPGRIINTARREPERHSQEDWRRDYVPPTVADCFECDQ